MTKTPNRPILHRDLPNIIKAITELIDERHADYRKIESKRYKEDIAELESIIHKVDNYDEPELYRLARVVLYQTKNTLRIIEGKGP